jgi:signal transduction histidine kinase
MRLSTQRRYSKLKASNTKLLIALCIGLLSLVIYFITNNYFTSLQKSKEEVLHRLMGISRTAALFIDGSAHQELSLQFMEKDAIKTSNQEERYLHLHLLLAKIKNENQLESPLYTIVYYQPDSTFHFIGTSSEIPYYRHAYKNYPKELLTHHASGGILDSYKDENGHWLSAFTPIKNKQGEVVGLLEADENFEVFLSRARRKLLIDSAISLAIVIPFGIFLFSFLNRSLKKQTEDQVLLIDQKEEIESQNEEITSQNELIEKQNKDLDYRVKARTKELEETNAELANFLYHSSHDVQAPIATLKGLQNLIQIEKSDEEKKKYIGLMHETTNRLERIVKSIKQVYEVRTISLNITKINLRECVQNVIDLFDNHNSIRLNIAPINLEIHTNKLLLQTAIRELLINSTQYAEENITTNIKVDISTSNNQIHILVEDNGSGISPEMHNKLFTLFHRGHIKSTGLGLGLYTTQICLNRLQGSIKLVEKKDRGAAFLLVLKN